MTTQKEKKETKTAKVTKQNTESAQKTKTQKTQKNMSSNEQTNKTANKAAKPEKKSPSKPANKSERKALSHNGEGDYYHIEVRPKTEFTKFRTQDVGKKGGTQRVAGQRSSGTWSTHKWLINKNDAYIDKSGYLHGKDRKTRDILEQLGSIPHNSEADNFTAKPRKDVPEKEKSTKAPQTTRQANIKKANETRAH